MIKKIAVNLLRRLPQPFCRLPEEWVHSRYRDNLKHILKKQGRNFDPKVFGIGLSKTGTTSLAQALQHLGYRTLHYDRVGRVIGWPDFLEVDAATDTPCSAQFESLYHTFEGSKFIYTTRDIDSWKQSIVNHTGLEHPGEWQPRDWKFRPGRFHTLVRSTQIKKSLYCHHDSWEEAYRVFDQRVEKFFEDEPDNRLLKMNITSGDGWDTLCSFLGHEVPERSFPHANRSDEN